MSISESELKMIDDYSKDIDMQDLGLFWQLTIKTLDDLKIVGNENIVMEMYIMQMVHLKNLDEYKSYNADKNLNNETQQNLLGKKIEKGDMDDKLSNQIKNQLKSTDQIKPNPVKISNESEKTKIEITSFNDLVDLANKEKEIELKYDLERNVKLVSFNKGKINICFNESLNKNFIKNLTEKLLKWTGERWIITLSKNTEAKSLYEKNQESKNNLIEVFRDSKIAKEIEAAFPDAELIDVQNSEE